MFKLNSIFQPKGDQPTAIRKLSDSLLSDKKEHVLLGITGSGKTFTVANVIACLQKPALILAHNKTLAAQLYQEFKFFFPENSVEYFVSYYDYYQPEAYIARTNTYIEKEMAINDRIDRMRLSATRSLIQKKDVLIVASISCIYGLGVPQHYIDMHISFRLGDEWKWSQLISQLLEMNYKENSLQLMRGHFRTRDGCNIEIVPAYEEHIAYEIKFVDNKIDAIFQIDSDTGSVVENIEHILIFPGSHHVAPEEVRLRAIESIKQELDERSSFFEKAGKNVERQRILDRTHRDLEMIKKTGRCKGIENYSRHFNGRFSGEPPSCLIDYFPADFLLFIDESHQTLPQLRAMYNGDRVRKRSLIEFGFRLPSAYDNRPLMFEEFYSRTNQIIYVSATPGRWEIEQAGGEVIEQIVRPTGLLDPLIEIRSSSNQIDDLLQEIRRAIKNEGRVLVITLTKKWSEDLSHYLGENGISAAYIHSNIDTLQRIEIIEQLRRGHFDVLIGINLLREGIDIPEVELVVILDADKEGFLRSQTSLIQICGRAARNAKGRVIMYADDQTEAIRKTVAITTMRRSVQEKYNTSHQIIPQTVKRAIQKMDPMKETLFSDPETVFSNLSPSEITDQIDSCRSKMRKAAKERKFEEAARFRDILKRYQEWVKKR